MAIYEEEPTGNPAPVSPEVGPQHEHYTALAGKIVPDMGQPPEGTYSSARLKAFLKALNAKIEAGGAEAISAPTEEIEAGPLPETMYQAYIACRAMAEDFATANPEEEVQELPDAMSLVDDSSLALASVSLQKLAGNKKFSVWAKRAQPAEDADIAPELPMEEPAVADDAAAELAALA